MADILPVGEMRLYHKGDPNDDDYDYFYDGCERCGDEFHNQPNRIPGVERYKRTEICENCAHRSKVAHGIVIPKGPGNRCADRSHMCTGGCERWFCQTQKESDRTYVPIDKISCRDVRYQRFPREYRNACDDCWMTYLMRRRRVKIFMYFLIALECAYPAAHAVAQVL